MSRNSSPPWARSPSRRSPDGQRGAAAVRLDVGHQLVDLLVGEDSSASPGPRPPGGPAACGRCAPGSRPTPRRRRSATGRGAATPSRFAPWQVMQLVLVQLRARPPRRRTRCWCRRRPAPGRTPSTAAPVRTRPTMRPATLASRRRCLDRRRDAGPAGRARRAAEPPCVGRGLGLRVRGGHRFPSGSGRSWRRARPTRRRRSASSRRPRWPRSPVPA